MSKKRKIGRFIGVCMLLTNIAYGKEPAIDLIIHYIDKNIEKFEYSKIDSSPALISTYSYDGVSISQHLLPGSNSYKNLVYKFNDQEIDTDVGRHLFYHIEDKLKELEKSKAKSAKELSRYATCELIENVMKGKIEK